MSKTPTMTAIIDITANTEDAKKKLTELEKLALKIEKDGTKYKVEVDESGLVKVKKIVDEIKADSKNKVSFLELDKSMESKINEYIKKFNSLSEAIRHMFSDAFNGNMSSGISNESRSIDELNNKLKETNRLLEEKKKLFSEAKANYEIAKKAETESAKAVKDSWAEYIKSDDKKSAQKFAAEYKNFNDMGYDSSLLKGKDPWGQMMDADAYESRYQKIMKSYKNSAAEIKKIISSINKGKEENGIEIVSKEDILNLKKQALEYKKEYSDLINTKKSLENEINSKTTTDIKGNKESPGGDKSSDSIDVRINPINLDEFYSKIENHKVANIKVDFDNEKELSDKLKDIGDNSKNKETSANVNQQKEKITYSQTFKDVISYANNNKKKSSNEVYKEIASLLKNTIDSKSSLNDDQAKQLIALVKSYKKKSGKDSPVSDILKFAGIEDFGEVLGNYKNIKEEFNNELRKFRENEKSQKINNKKTDTSKNSLDKDETDDSLKKDLLNLDKNKLTISKESITALKSQIESTINPIELQLSLNKYLDSLKADFSSVKSTLNESLNSDNNKSELATSINSISDIFSNVTNSIVSDTNKQIESITSVKTAIDELSASLDKAGVKTVDEFANFQKEFTKLQQEQENLNKQKEEFKNAQAEAAKKQDSPANKLTGSEMINARDSIVEAAKNTKNFNIDVSSIKFDKDGVMSFKAVIDETSDSITIAEYKIKDFNKAVTASGKLSKKYLDNNTSGIITKEKKISQKDINKSIEERLKKAVDKTEGLSLDSLKIDDSGIATLTVDLQKAGEEAKKLQFQIENIDSVINKRGRNAGAFTKDFLGSGTDITNRDELDKLTKEYTEAIELRRKIEESGTRSTDAGLQRYLSAVQKEMDLENKLNDLKERSNLTDEEKLNNQNQINQAKTKELELYNAKDLNQNKIDTAQLQYDRYAGNINPEDYANLETVIGGQVVNVRNRISELQAAATQAMDALRAGTFDSKEGFDQTNNSLTTTLKLLRELTIEKNQKINKQGEYLGAFGINGNLSGINQKDLKKQLGDMLSDYNEQVKDISVFKGGRSATANVINDGQIKKATMALEEYQTELGETAVKVRVLYDNETKYESAATKWVNGIKSKVHSLTQYVTGLDLVMRAWTEVQQGFTFVKELDSTMTTVYQTMDITRQGLAELSSGAIDAAKDLGATSEQVTDAIGIYAAYGETVDSILSQTRPTTMLANAAGTDAKTAADQIQGVLQQYEELKGQEMRIVNSYEKIAANVQIDFDKGINAISEGVSVAGSVARDAGLEFEEFAGIVASVAETTRLEGSVIGNAMKTIMSRISRSKTADPDVTAKDRSEAAKAYEEVAGIQLYDDQGNYKDFSETLSELAGKWDTLTDAERNYIAEQSAGVRNVNIFTTMMDKYSQSMELANAALEDTDFAEGVQDKWMESMQGKLNTLRASMQEFWTSVLDTGVINFGIEGLTTIVNLAEGLLGIFGSIKESIGGLTGSITSFAAAAATAYASFKTFQNIKSTGNILGGLSKTGSGLFGMLSNIPKLFSKDGFKSLFGGLKDISKKYNELAKGGKVGILESFGEAGGGLSGLTAGFSALAGKIGISTAALGGFVGAAAGIGVAALAFDHFTESSEETAKAVAKASEEYQASKKEIQSQADTVDSIGLEWETLSQGVDEFGNNISLTTDEFARYNELTNQIADMFPTLVSGYTETGTAIINLKNGMQDLNAEYERNAVLSAQQRMDEYGDLYQKDFNNVMGNKSWGTKAADMWSEMTGGSALGRSLDWDEVYDKIEKIREMSAEEVREYIRGLDYAGQQDYSALGITTFDLNKSEEEWAEDWHEKQQELTDIFNEANEEISSATSNQKAIIQDYWTTLSMGDGIFADLDDDLKKQISSLLSSLPTEALEDLGSLDETKDFVREFIQDISDNEQAQISLDNLLNIDEDTNIAELSDKLKEDISNLSEITGLDENQITIMVGLEEESDLVDQYHDLMNQIRSDTEDSLKAPIDQLMRLEDPTADVRDLSSRMDSFNYNMGRFTSDTGLGEKKSSNYAATYHDFANNKSIVLTPVLPNGEILSEAELNEYASQILAGKEVDVDITLGTFEGKDNTKQAKEFAKQINKSAKEYDNMADSAGDVEEYIRENGISTQEQLDLLKKCVAETDSLSEAFRQFEIKDVNLDANAEKIKELEANLEIVEETITQINEATDQSHESMGLTGEQIENVVKAFSGLDSYDYDKLFESTAAGVHLNVQELERLNGEYERAEKQKYTDMLTDLEDQYAGLCIQIEEATTATERNQKVAERNDIEEQISQIQELISRYDGLTNSVTKFQQAMEGSEEGDTYDYVAESAEEIKRLYDEGLTGTRKFRAYVQMMTNEDMSGKSNKEYIDMYEKQKALMESLFTEDSATGAENFLKKLQGITDESGRAMAAYDAANDSWKIFNADVSVIAEQLGVSEGAITEIFKKLNDFGFDIDFVEETDHLKAMREEAQKANEAFNDFSTIEGFEDFKFDLTVTDDKALQEQIDTAEKLRDVLINTYGPASEQVKQFDAQLDYLKATAGQTIDALDFSLNYTDDQEELNKVIETLKQIDKYKDLEINFATTSVTNVENQLSDVQEQLVALKGDDGRINLEAEGAAELMDIFIALTNKKIELERPAVAKLDINDFSGDYQVVMQMIQDYQTAMENLEKYQALATVDVKYEANVEEAQKQVDSALAAIKGSTEDQTKIMAKMGIDTSEVNQDNLNMVLSGLDSNIMVTAGFELSEEAQAVMGQVTADETKTVSLDTTLANAALTTLTNEIKEEVTKPVKLQAETTAFDEAIRQKTLTTTKTVIVNEKAGTKVSGTSELNGTAHATGTALAGGTSGNWGLPKDETALVGEVAPELRVNSKTGQWELLGSQGAEFRKLNKGDIIFNGDQTKEIFEKGYIKSRGKALVKGTVNKLNSLFKVGTGSAYAGGYSGGGSFGYSGSGKDMWTNNKDKNKKESKADEPKEEDFDWIEILIDRIERAIDRLDTVASSAYKSFTKRNDALRDQFSKVTEEIEIQQKAYEAYMREANAIGLSETYAKKVRDGTLDVETIVDNEELVDQINKYQDLYEKALDCSDAIVELKENLGDIAEAKFDLVVDEYEAQLSEIESKIDLIENGLDIVEAKGNFASKDYFEALIATEQQNINKLSQEYTALQNSFNEAMNSGAIEQGSEAWYNMQEQIRDVNQAIQEGKLSLIEYQNQMREMDWDIFDKLIEYQSALTDESDFLKDLMSVNDNDLFVKETGELSNMGQTVGGLHAMDYNVYMAQADEYRKKIEELNAEIAKDPTNTTLLDKKNEYLEAQREAILNAEEEKVAVKDLIADSYERMLNILQELIDKRKEALQAEKDLYDYQKNIEEQTKNITDLQKQLVSLQGDDSEEAKSKRQQLEDQLKNAQSDLEETEYDKWLEDQQRLMDDYYDQFEEYLNGRLDNIDGLMSEMIDSTNANSSMIDQTIKDTTNDVGYKVTDGMNNVWNNTSGGIGKVVSDYTSNFMSVSTTTNNYLKSIQDLINKIVTKSKDEITSNTGGAVTGGGSGGSSGGSGSGSSGSNNSGNNSGNSSSSGGNKSPGWFFSYKKDNYPKSKLNINTSITDRLKYHDFDSSWDKKKYYYEQMGLGSASSYTGSYSQNVAMINWMKKNGFSQGGHIGDLIDKTGETGFALVSKGEEILSIDKLKIADSMVSKLVDFEKYTPKTSAISGHSFSTNAEVHMNFTLPNVKDSQSFLREIQTNKQVQKALVDVTIGKALGKNSLNVNKRK